MFEPVEKPKAKMGRHFLYGDSGCDILPLSLDKKVIAWLRSKELGRRSYIANGILKKAMEEEQCQNTQSAS